jgi:hypothetical protein
MTVSITHLFRQGPTIKTLVQTAAHSVANYGSREAGTTAAVPGPRHSIVVKPRHPALIRDFIRHTGGNPAAYKGVLPPCMFPQWGMPMLARTLDGLKYDLTRILNGGFRLEIDSLLPADKPLHLRSWLEGIDDNGRRVIFRQALVTGTEERPDAVTALVTAVLPLKSDRNGQGKKERWVVPEGAVEIARWKLPPGTGLDFGMLTGDLNPVHWSRAYARLSGFKGTIMHGFNAAARMVETMNRVVWSGRIDRWRTIEARFVRPFPYPSSTGVYTDFKGGFFVGDAPGGPAFVTGAYTVKEGWDK